MTEAVAENVAGNAAENAAENVEAQGTRRPSSAFENEMDEWDNSLERQQVRSRSMLQKQSSLKLSRASTGKLSRASTARLTTSKSWGRASTLGWLGQDDDTTSGILADFVKRERSKAKNPEATSQQYLERVLTRSKALQGKGMKKVMGVLQYEQLYAMMMASVVQECKDRGLFARTPANSFKQQCKTIHQLKRLTLTLSTAVLNWHFTFRLLNSPVRPPLEPKVEKLTRLSEFWSEGLWIRNDLRLLEGARDVSDERPRYDLCFDLQHQGRWGVRKRAGTLTHQQHEKAKLLTAGGRPEDGAGDGRFPPKELEPIATAQLLAPARRGRKLYLDKCREKQVIPSPLLFMTGHTHDLKANGQLFTDAELLAAMTLLRDDFAVHELDLAENGLLTDRSLVPLLEKLSLEAVCAELQRLSLAGCRQMGRSGIFAVIQLTAQAPKLRALNLTNIHFSTHGLLPLCQAIGSHKSLRDVSLAGTGLGNNSLTLRCLASLFKNNFLRKLDLSWNRFNHEEFAEMGRIISGSLEELKVDYCAAYVVGRDSPVAELLEGLGSNTYLKKLSLIANRVDFRTALVIEDVLDMHPALKDIDMTDNPLGALGMRSLLRLLSRAQNALKHFRSDGCYQGITAMMEEGQGCQVYSFTNPGSRYVLDLSRPYHRSLLRILYKTAERYKLTLDKAFEFIEADPPYQHASKQKGIWQVPSAGRVVFNFSVEAQIQASLSGVDDDDYLGFLDTHFELTRFKADRKKIPALFAKWLELLGREEDQHVYLAALAKDFNMSLPYLSYLCSSAPGSVRHTMMTMFPTVPSDTQSRYLAMLCFPRLSDFYVCYGAMEALLLFNAQNATGHYKLDLGNSCEFAVAQRLILLDRWEAVVNKRRARCDVSASANRSQLRNETHQGRDLLLRVKSVAEWSLPEYDIFELDYVSSYRPPAKAQALSDELWESLMVTMYNFKDTRPEDKIKALRSISHLIFIKCMHMRQMVGYFQEAEHREEAFVTFFNRVIDMHNAKQFTVRFDSEEELIRLRSRLGYVTFFPFLQPENAKFVLNLKYNDQRMCASILVDLALHEKYGNIREYTLINEEGNADPMTMGVPRSWADFAKAPTTGTFKCRYVCAPEDRQVDYRKKLAQSYGFINSIFSEADVAWWTGLNEVGSDVLDLLEFFISRYNNVNEAFHHIDGGVKEGEGGNTTSNGELTLREFEAGLRDIGCHKFKGANEKERIGAVFRYLDPGGEGNVSLQEWQILGQLWKEFVLSIQEFVQFLFFAFGDELEFAWDELDDDGSGELSEDEWFSAVKRIGYFGPARVVFALLDGSDDGNISWDEFQELEKYRPKKKEQQG